MAVRRSTSHSPKLNMGASNRSASITAMTTILLIEQTFDFQTKPGV
jgi:hypothetical protein